MCRPSPRRIFVHRTGDYTSPPPIAKTIRSTILQLCRNRAVDSVQVIEELIDLANEIRDNAARARELGLSEEEIAF